MGSEVNTVVATGLSSWGGDRSTNLQDLLEQRHRMASKCNRLYFHLLLPLYNLFSAVLL